MRAIVSSLATLILLSGLSAGAGAQSAPNLAPKDGQEIEQGVGVGVGLVCDTVQQAERWIALRDTGEEAPRAVEIVNDEAQNPRACGLAAVAFTHGVRLAEKNMRGKLVTIAKITIIAVNNGASWAKVPDIVQYTVVEAAGLNV
jgi:hypothetical protein